MRKILLLVLILFSVSAFSQEVKQLPVTDSLKDTQPQIEKIKNNLADGLKAHALDVYNQRVLIGTSAPSGTAPPKLFMRTSNGDLYSDNNGAWRLISASTSAISGSGTNGLIAKFTGTNSIGNATAGTDYENPLTFSSPLVRTVNTVSIPAATSSVNGYLGSTDWSTFNNKQSAISFGTGVQTALGVNIGSAGAPVLFNGAGGTPSSLALASATGLPVSTGISGLGTSVATALAVNVGSAGAFVTNGGALGTPSSGVATNLTGTAAGLTAGSVTGLSVTAGKTLSVSNSLTLAGTDSTTMTFPSTSKTILANDLSNVGTITADLIFTDNTYDIGKSLATRPRNYWGAGDIRTAKSGGYIEVASDGHVGFTSRTELSSPSDGVLELSNNAISDFTRLQFGGTTSSFPAIKRNAAAINFRLADDSADAAITSAGITASGAITTSNTTDSTTTTTGALQVAGGAAIRKRVFIDGITQSSGLQTAVLCQSSGGEMIADTVACLASSRRFKYAIKPLNSGLNEILRFRPVSFFYKSEGIFAKNPNFQRERVGLIAEEVVKVDQRLVGFEKDNMTPRTVGYEQIVPVLIKGMQEQQAEIETLKSQVAKLSRAIANQKRTVRHRHK